MAGFSSEIGNDLRDFSDTPAKEANQPKTEGDLVAGVAEAVLEVCCNPPHHACLLLLHAV